MNKKELLKLVGGGETQNLELTEDAEDVGKSVCSLVNTNNGIILVGVSDDKEIVGCTEKDEQKIANIAHTCKPSVYPKVERVEVNGKNVFVIEVKKSDQIHSYRNVAYKRIGTHDKPLSPEEVIEFAKSTGRIRFDSQVCEEASLEDIDGGKVRWFIREARKQRGIQLPETLSIKDTLMKLKLTKNEKLTNTALLLFSKEQMFLQSEVKCIRFSGNEPVKPYTDFQTLAGSVFDLIDRAEDFVLRNIRKSIWLVPGQVQREEKHEYPPDAIREAITNAIVHRDYESPSKVQVRVFDDYIEIWNPGRLPEGWTVEKLKQKHESIPKNPLLFKQLFWVKYVEDVGGGTIDMVNECREWGVPEPEFEDTGTSIVVTFGRSVITEKLMDKLGLNERQKKAIDYLKEHRKITNKEYCKLFGVVKDTANRDLNDLLDKNLIKRKGSGPKTYYALTTVRYRPIPSDNMSKKHPKHDNIAYQTPYLMSI